ncbi:MAG: hypothetical protein N3A54_04080 [Patescibacteria group bacterium]|nr:hypothetical protein [Patescibacteria group bacterium]
MRVSFFTQNRWAFGNIHHSLAKVLYEHGYIAEVIDFTVPYKLNDFQHLIKSTDLFITNPDAVEPLRSYGTPYSKIAIVAHAEWDILRALSISGPEMFNKVKSYGVISKHLLEKSREFGIEREPTIVRVGVVKEKYSFPLPTALKTIGYAGAFSSQNWKGEEIKRGYLVDQIFERCQKIGLDIQYKKHEFFMWQSMPAYYESVDLILITSTEEGGGLPYMEAAASGRGIITTPVGYAKESAAGLILPFNEDVYVYEAVKYIKDFYENPQKFVQEHCKRNREYAERFDWRVRVIEWLDFISRSL